jgi:hypothetical protein
MTIKKAYLEVIAHLEANSNKKVSSVLEDIKAMCEAKNGGGSDIGKTYLKDSEGNTIAVYCYYFKKWMPTSQVMFGNKVNTASGLNTMCKEGVSLWTKQQREAKKANEQLLTDLGDSTITVEELPAKREAIEADRKIIKDAEDTTHHYDTAEEVLEAIAKLSNASDES